MTSVASRWTPSRQKLARFLGARPLAWLVPVFVAVLVRRAPGRMSMLVGLIVGTAILALIMRAPGTAMVALAVILPFHLLLISLLFRLGLPVGFLKAVANWKEVFVAGIALAGLVRWRKRGGRLDTLDRVAILYLAGVSAYFLFPTLFVGSAQNGSPGPPTALHVRLLGFRTDVLFVAILIGARHANIQPETRRRLAKAVFAVGVVIATTGVFEFLSPSTWNHFVVSTLGVPKYQAVVLQFARNATDVLHHDVVAGRPIVRVGSVFLNPLVLGMYLLVPLSIGAEAIARRRAKPAVYLGTAVIGCAIIFTVTRTAILGAVIVCILTLRPAPARPAAARVRFALAMAACLILVLPVAVGSGLTSRTFSGDEGSTTSHLQSLRGGLTGLVQQPLGRGLGTAPGVGDRFPSLATLTSENAYIQVGNELGIPVMIAFIVLILVLLRRLRRAADDEPDALLPRALCSAGLALAVGGLFLHVWLDFVLAWTFWGASGLVVGLSDQAREASSAGAVERTWL